MPLQQTEIPFRLKNMVDLLVDEQSRLEDATDTTGVCMEYLLKNNILTKLVNICDEGDKPRGIIGETIRTMASMVNLLDDRFLVHNAVHKPIVKLLRICCAPGNEVEGDDSYHEDLIDLMYILCSKIHGYPELLNIFFYDKQWLTVPERLAAKRLRKSRETMAFLRSWSQQSSIALSTIDDDTSPATTAATILGQKIDSSTPISNSPGIQTKTQPSISSEDVADISASDAKDLEINEESKTDYEFLLFTYLSKFVHREGKAGDFARTGLLFLMELATGSLGEYILDSDFATYLTAGIGALYSQLPRQLIVRGGVNTTTDAKTASPIPTQEPKPSSRSNIEFSSSPDFQSRLDAFLKVLEFCQDVLMRCPNSNIINSLLSSLKVVFLENILYPSILECSDTDGSSVAVISYIDQILQILEHDALVDLVVGFLMESEEEETRNKELEDSDAFAEVQNPQTTSPYFTATGRFTLKDLVLSRLKSRSQPTVIATLKLLNTIITHHCKYLLNLLSIQPDSRVVSAREQLHGTTRGSHREVPKVNHHTHELDLFFSLITTINPNNSSEVFCCGYESYLRDAEASVETHRCLIRRKDGDSQEGAGTISESERKKQRRRSMKYGNRLDIPEDQPREAFIKGQDKSMGITSMSRCHSKGSGHAHVMQRHRLLPSDPLLQTLLGTLSHFFAHSVELNLALTGVITSLAQCPHRSLEGWLLFRASDIKKPYVDRGSEDESDSESTMERTTESHNDIFNLTPQAELLYDSDNEDSVPIFIRTRSNPTTTNGPPSFKSFPPFFTMLRTLTQQVDYYRSEIDGFDDYLVERRRNLLYSGDTNASSLPSHQGFSVDQFLLNNALNSNDSFISYSGGAVGSPRPSTPSRSVSSSSLTNGPISPQTPGSGDNSGSGSRTASPAPQRALSNTPVAGGMANPVSIVKTRPRKSSSPSSLMSSPSNMSFLVPPGIGGKRNFKSSSASPLAGDSTGSPGPRYPSEPDAHDSEAQVSLSTSHTRVRSTTISQSTILQPKSQWGPTQAPATGLPKPIVFGGMATAGLAITTPGQVNHSQASVSPGQNIASAFLQAKSPLGPSTIMPLSKVTDTMMIKPLFADGFLDDSECEAESSLNIDAETSEDDEEDDTGSGSKSISSSDDGDEIERQANSDLQVPTTKASSRTRKLKGKHSREGSSGANMISSMSSSGSSNNKKQGQEKLVSLGQLLTNVIILEEVLKEVLAVTQVRKAMGVDQVLYF
ncbi:hypothetical protein BGZ46_010729 [Entomortierella lignicola]|nr:hypothetical protein BGZ46_010729 [Entomortierella lignicola]